MISNRLKIRWRHLAIVGMLVFLALIPFNWFLGQYTSLVIFIGISTMVTVGLCLLLGYTGQVSLGQAAFYGMGAYFSAVLTKGYGFNPWLAMCIGAAATGTFAYIIGYPIFRLRGNYLAMATLGLGLVMYVLFRQLTQFTGGPDGMAGIPFLSAGNFVFDTPFKRYYLVWGFTLAVLLLSQNMVRSRIGRALRAVHGSEEAAESLGVNVTQFKVKIFVLSAVYASLAGSLFVHHLRFVSPQPFDFLASVIIVVMAVVGGLASIWGAIFGAATIQLLSNELLLGFGKLDIAVYGLILVLVMIFMPEGVFVKLKQVYAARRETAGRLLPARLKRAAPTTAGPPVEREESSFD
ncbi:MAG: branched-chain amino acid ABC transporter permease [Dehalococcoidia bacterium]|nr:branched-chain amino acid ABC transporter permease [Dehalococcoidia bacterium]